MIREILKRPLFSSVLAFNLALALFMTSLNTLTVLRRQMLLEPKAYIFAAMLGIVGCLIFSMTGATAFNNQIHIQSRILIVAVTLLPSFVLIQGGLAGLLGAKGAWKSPFFVLVATGTLFFGKLTMFLLRDRRRLKVAK